MPIQANTAARLELFLLGGTQNVNFQIGLGQRLDIDDNYNFRPLQGIGSHYTLGWEPGIYEGRANLSVVRLSNQAMARLGVQTHRGIIQQLNARGMELVVRDKRGEVVDQLTDVYFDTVRTSVDVGQQLVMEDIGIVFVRITDET